MIALDTNVLVRYFMMDDSDQSARAASLIERCADEGRQMFVSHIVLSELVWVLASAYSLSKVDLTELLATILRTAQFQVEDSDLAHRALNRFRAGRAGFADFLVSEAAIGAGCEELATFDRRLLAEQDCVEP